MPPPMRAVLSSSAANVPKPGEAMSARAGGTIRTPPPNPSSGDSPSASFATIVLSMLVMRSCASPVSRTPPPDCPATFACTTVPSPSTSVAGTPPVPWKLMPPPKPARLRLTIDLISITSPVPSCWMPPPAALSGRSPRVRIRLRRMRWPAPSNAMTLSAAPPAPLSVVRAAGDAGAGLAQVA